MSRIKQLLGLGSKPKKVEALAPQIPLPPDAGPWRASEWFGSATIVIQSSDLQHDVALIVDGTFDSKEDKLLYAVKMAEWLNAMSEAAQSGHIPAAPASPSLEPSEPKPDGAMSPAAEPTLEEVESVTEVSAAVEPALDDSLEPLDSQALEQLMAPVEDTSLHHPQVQAPLTEEQQLAEAAKAVEEVTRVVGSSKTVPWGCHCELPPGATPDQCVHDLGQPNACVHAAMGIQKRDCQYWRPILFVKK